MAGRRRQGHTERKRWLSCYATSLRHCATAPHLRWRVEEDKATRSGNEGYRAMLRHCVSAPLRHSVPPTMEGRRKQGHNVGQSGNDHGWSTKPTYKQRRHPHKLRRSILSSTKPFFRQPLCTKWQLPKRPALSTTRPLGGV